MTPFGLAETLHDAVSLAGVSSTPARLGIGAAQAAFADILAPESLNLSLAEAQAALKLGRPQYIFTFGNHQADDIARKVAPMIGYLTSATNVGFMAACLATPTAQRTVYQGHLFEAGRLRGDLVNGFATELTGGVGLVAHEIVLQGAGAIRRQCAALKEQGKMLALIDAITPDDCTEIAKALNGQALTGGAAWLAGQPLGPTPAPAPTPASTPAATPATTPATMAIISGALARQAVFQAGFAGQAIPVFNLNPAAANTAAQALAWAAGQTDAGRFLISSSVPPDKTSPNPALAPVFASIAAGLAGQGIRHFMVTGNDTGQAVLQGLGLTQLTTTSHGPLTWFEGASPHGPISICFKPAALGARNIYLSDLAPQSPRAEMATA